MKRILMIIAGFLFSFTSILQSQGIPFNQEFQVNTYIQNQQELPCVSNLPDGGFVVCWQSYNQNCFGDGIYGQLFNKDGSRRGTEFQVDTCANCDQKNPTVTHLKDGRFIVCWEYHPPDGKENNILGQIFNCDGTRLDSEFQVNSNSYGYQINPCVDYLIDGGFVVCWQSLHDGMWYIHGQLFDSEGSKRGYEFQTTTYSTTEQTEPSVTHLSDGGFVVCYESHGICGQIFLNDGSKYGEEIQMSTDITRNQRYPSVSYLADGRFIVCWAVYPPDGSYNSILGQLFNRDGSKLGSEFQVNSYINSFPDYASVNSSTNDNFIVCWQSYPQDSGSTGIYGQLFDNNGIKRGSEFQVNTYKNSSQEQPDVNFLTNGGFVVCWQSYFQDGSSWGIYGKYCKAINHHLSSFSLLNPSFDKIVQTTKLVLIWAAATSTRINLPWELEYHLYLDNNENFSNPQIVKAIYDTTYTVDSLTPGTTNFWKVLAKNIEGDSLWSSETYGFFVSYDATIVEETVLEKLQDFKLYANYPNPFNPVTTIRYDLSTQFDVSINIYNVSGRLIRILVADTQLMGSYKVEWDGRDNKGLIMPSGIYIYRIQAGDFKDTKCMLLLK